jgi:hypothetical protein
MFKKSFEIPTGETAPQHDYFFSVQKQNKSNLREQRANYLNDFIAVEERNLN